MKEETHEKMKKIQLFVAISLLLVCAGMLFKNPGITGHFSADFRSQPLDLVIDQSQSYLIKTNTPEPIHITSFRLSGNIIGDGSVEIFIEDQGNEFLIYKNVREKERGLPTITGRSIAAGTASEQPEETEEKLLLLEPLDTLEWKQRTPLSEKEEFVAGLFDNKCSDTCFIEMPLSSEETYKLIVMVEPGTKLEITKLTYILKNENI